LRSKDQMQCYLVVKVNCFNYNQIHLNMGNLNPVKINRICVASLGEILLEICLRHCIGCVRHADVDECSTTSGICSNGRCVNFMGGYECLCDPGFEPTPRKTSCQGSSVTLFCHFTVRWLPVPVSVEAKLSFVEPGRR